MARTQFNPLDQTVATSAAAVNPVSAANTTADNTFVALTVPGGEIAGACYSIKAYGSGTGAQGTTLTFWIAINGGKAVSIPLTLANTFVSGSPILWSLEAMVTRGGTGATASIRVDGELLWTINVNTGHASGAATVNQGSAWTIAAGCTMGTAAANTGVTCNQALIRRF